MVKIINSSEEFEQTLKEAGDKLVVVDFFATWCGPCKMIAPKLVEHQKTYEGKIIIIKVDVDELEDLAAEKQISAMPTFQFYKNGQKVDELTGANNEKLLELIKKHL